MRETTTRDEGEGRPSVAASDDDLQRSLRARLGARYQLIERVGSGGMGTVFRAVDETLQRPVAVKVVRRDMNAPDATRRLIDEARTMAKLRHPNLCQVIEADTDGDPVFIVMEWVAGLPLHALLVDLPLARGLEILLDVTDGAAEMHRAGLVHRDLKPANVLVDAKGRAIIVDFGLTRISAVGDPVTHAGTPAYSAPEQFETADTITPAADVFAIGRMLFELITARRMADAPLIDGALPLPETLNPRVDPALQRICLQAIDSEPSRRYQSARELGEDLRRRLRGETVLARPCALADRFSEQVDEQLVRVESWRRHGMISQPEHRRLRRILASARRPESPWIMESRRLTPSQVSLYVGGWVVILSLSIGMWHVWDHLATGVGSAIAWTAQLVLLCGGTVLHRARDRRFAMMWLTTAAIAWPIAVWLLVREVGLLTPALDEDGCGPSTELVAALFQAPHEPGFGNAQILVIAVSWAVCAAVLRGWLRASVFTSIAAVALLPAWSAMWLVGGRLRPDEFSGLVFSEYATWMLALAILFLLGGLILDHGDDDPAAASEPPVRDAAPVLSLGVVMLPAALGAIAYLMPRRFLLTTSDEPPTIEAQAFGFIAAGALVELCAFALGRRETILRARLGELLRWVGPTFLLAPLFVLERENAYGLWWLWLPLMAVASLGFCAGSVTREWKPYLFAGLGYLAVAYARLFVRIREHLDEPGQTVISIVVGSVVVGITIMIAAWAAPRMRAQRGFS